MDFGKAMGVTVSSTNLKLQVQAKNWRGRNKKYACLKIFLFQIQKPERLSRGIKLILLNFFRTTSSPGYLEMLPNPNKLDVYLYLNNTGKKCNRNNIEKAILSRTHVLFPQKRFCSYDINLTYLYESFVASKMNTTASNIDIK